MKFLGPSQHHLNLGKGEISWRYISNLDKEKQRVWLYHQIISHMKSYCGKRLIIKEILLKGDKQHSFEKGKITLTQSRE